MLLDTRKTSIKKQLQLGNLYFKIFSIWPPVIFTHFSHCSYNCPCARQSPPPCDVSHPHPAPSRRPPGWGWGQPTCSSPPADSPNSEIIVQDGKGVSPLKSVWPPHNRLLSELQILVKNCVNHFSWHVIAWASFLTLSYRPFFTLMAILAMEPFVLSFLWSTAVPRVSPPSPCDNHLYLGSFQGLAIKDLLSNFLKLLKAFLAVAGDFTKSLWHIIGGGKGRKINRGLAPANQLRDRGKGLKQKLLKIESAIKNI